MSVTVLTPSNTYRLTTLEAVMAEITMEDNLVFAESLIDQASAAVARECGTIFAQQRYRETDLGHYGGVHLFLTYGPLVSVSPVSAGAETITDYRIDSAESALLYRRLGWRLPWWGEDEWSIDYVAGFVLPEQLNPPEPTGPTLRQHAPDVERACIECCKIWFAERQVSDRILSRSLGDQTIRYDLQSGQRGLPLMAKDLLKSWKRVVMA